MSIFRIPLAWLLFLILASCSDNELLPALNTDDANASVVLRVSNSYQRSEEEAKAEALSFLSGTLAKETRTPVMFSKTHYVLNQMAQVRGNSGEKVADTLLYVLQLQGGGSMVVSGDRRVPAVLVYLEENTFVPSKLTEEELNEITDFILDYWVNEGPGSRGDSLFYDPSGRLEKIKCVDAKKETVHSMIPWQWEQGWPYNKMAPQIKGGRALAGCAAIAVAIVASWHQHPKSLEGRVLNWDAINRPLPETRDAPYLVRMAGNYLENDWGVKATGTKYQKIAPALQKLGYSCSDASAYDDERIWNNVKNGLPVIISGYRKKYKTLGIIWGYKDGHVWVIDGAIKVGQKWYVSTNGEEYQHRLDRNQYYYHCKWGQAGGKGDGYFLSGLFNWSDKKTYNERLRVVYDIKPNE